MTPVPTHHVSARLSAIAPSATLAVDAKARALKATGRPVVGFGAGESNFPTPDYVVEVVVAAAKGPANHKYSSAEGLPVPRETIVAKTLCDSGYEVSPDDILVTNGGKQVAFQTLAVLVDPDDKVLLPMPYWTTYPEAVTLTGGTTVEVFAEADQDYKVSVNQLEAVRTERTGALLLCSPSNPTDLIYTPGGLIAISQWIPEHGIWVIIDGIYEHLLYDDAQTAHIVQLVPKLAEQTVVLNDVAKTYTVTGQHAGWMTAPSDVTKAATSFQSHLTSNAANISRRAALAVASDDLTAVEQMRTTLDRRRRTMVEMLSQTEGLAVPVPHGVFYAYLSIEGPAGRMLCDTTIDSSATPAMLVLEHAEVAIVPSEAFGPSDLVQLSYTLGDDDLVEGVGHIQKLLTEVEQRLRPHLRHRAGQVSRQPTESLSGAAKPTWFDV